MALCATCSFFTPKGALSINVPAMAAVRTREDLVPAVSSAAITVTIASPGVVTDTAHGLTIGTQVSFTTTGALPTGLLPATNYFIIAAGFTANSYQLALTFNGAAINTSGTQSGVHTRTSIPGTTNNTAQPGEVALVVNSFTAAIAVAFGAAPDATSLAAIANSSAGFGLGPGASALLAVASGDKVHIRTIT